jgi:hypothetical protein
MQSQNKTDFILIRLNSPAIAQKLSILGLDPIKVKKRNLDGLNEFYGLISPDYQFRLLSEGLEFYYIARDRSVTLLSSYHRPMRIGSFEKSTFVSIYNTQDYFVDLNTNEKYIIKEERN